GDIDGDGRPELVAGDGWHQSYGRLARARLTVIRRLDGAFQATPVEDLPAHIRIVEILVRDLDGDGRGEILARGARSRSLGGDVRLYQRTTGGWRGRTLATDVQGFAIGSFTGGTAPEIVVAGGEPTPQPVSVGPDAGWDAQLAAPTNPVDVDAKTLVGKPAPALQVDAWLGGTPSKLLDLRGKVVLLDFWATWCKPCIAGFPTLRGWRKKFGADKLVVIGVTSHDGQTQEKIAAFVSEQKLPWRVAVDPQKRPHLAYGVGPIPHLVVIDRGGVVRLTHVGSGGLDEVEQTIARLLDR
ncbi:MAG: redoxin domain-containing protein, partial [Planctomycetota bacterium]